MRFFYKGCIAQRTLFALLASLIFCQSAAKAKSKTVQRRIFPETPPIQRTIAYIRMQPYNFEERLMLVSLQGIVNQTRPSLYLVHNDDHMKWLKWYKEKGYIDSYEEVKSIRNAILHKYRNDIKGAIIYDPDIPATINVATTLSGIEKGLITTETLAKTYHLPVIKDLRGKWKKNVDAYEWMYKELWPKISHNIIAFHPPKGIERIAQRDYAIQHKLFTFWISGYAEGQSAASRRKETTFAKKILRAMSPNTPVLGFPYAGTGIGPGELSGIALFTRYAKYDIVSSPNLSLHSAIKIAKLEQKHHAPPIKLEEGKTYVAFTISDGDNLNVWDRVHLTSWNQKQRGNIPINWNVMPSAIDLIPGIMQYYYETASPNDYFIVAGSGVGYANPYPYGKIYPNSREILKDYIGMLREYMQRMDLTVLSQYHLLFLLFTKKNAIEKTKEILSLYIKQIPSLKAIYPDYARTPYMNYAKSHYLLNGIPVFHALTQFDYLKKLPHAIEVEDRVKELKKYSPEKQTGFINAFLVNWDFQPKDIERILKEAGDRFIPVRADTMADLYLEYRSKK